MAQSIPSPPSANQNASIRSTDAAKQPEATASSWLSDTALSLVGYIVLAALCFSMTRHTLNYDGLCYLENAKRFAAGDWQGGVSGYWSPAISLLIAGFIKTGLDPLDAAHLAQLVAGLLFLTSVSILLRRTTDLSWNAKQAILALTALFAISEAALAITPDVLAASLLLQYFLVSGPQKSPMSGWRALCAGLIAAAAYLTKYFSLPLFVAHWTCISLARLVTSRQQLARSMFVSAIGVLGFAILSGPWIATLSARYHRLTFSIQTPYALYLGGPVGDTVKPLDTIIAPPPGRLTIWETPDQLSYEKWNPLAGKSQLLTHLKRCFKRVRMLCSQFQMVDSLSTFPSLLIVLAILVCYSKHTALLPGLLNVLLFTGICGAGYCAIYLNEFDCRRYVFTLIFPLHLIAVAGASWKLGWWTASPADVSPMPLLVRRTLLAIVFLAFALPSLERTATQLAFLSPQPSPVAAKTLADWNCTGPIAATSTRSWMATIAPAWRLQMAGAGRVPDDATFESAMDDLDRADVKTLVVEQDWAHRQRLSETGLWDHAGQLNICSTSPPLDVFRRKSSTTALTGRPADRPIPSHGPTAVDHDSLKR